MSDILKETFELNRKAKSITNLADLNTIDNIKDNFRQHHILLSMKREIDDIIEQLIKERDLDNRHLLSSGYTQRIINKESCNFTLMKYHKKGRGWFFRL